VYATASAPKTDTRGQSGDARTGGELFVSRGCRGCHATTAPESSVSPRVPNLSGIGIKVRADWLFNWVRSPRSYHPDTAMPQLTLSDDNVRHLAAFLLSRKDGADVVAAAPRFNPGADAAAGRTLIENYECASCHELKDFPRPGPAFELAPGDERETALRNGRLMVAYFNCRGCHRIEGNGGEIVNHLEQKSFAPPTLEGEGARVQTSWLIEFLQRPTNLRPWLQMRMPNYGLSEVRALALAQYFAALAGTPAADEAHPSAGEEIVARGLRRLAHFRCTQCHPTGRGSQLPEGIDPENLAIHFMLARTRLRPSWIRRFLADPKGIAGTQTRMPTVFYTVDGTPKVEHPGEDIEAIVAYLMEMKEAPEAVLARAEAERKKVQQEREKDWTTYQY